MAIYSLHHSSVGKSTQAEAYTAAAHIKYITRASALSRVAGARMPTASVDAMRFLRAAEDSDRKNARVVDKIMLALPRELNQQQRIALVRAYAEAITQGRASWLAAFHEKGKDAQNPHCHLVIRDRDTQTGKRVFGMSEKGSTEKLRELWEEQANLALVQANKEARIDRRTLEAQGIGRAPTIHEGVRGRRMHKARRKVRSRSRPARNSALAKSRTRTVDYPSIDNGRSRCAHNEQLRARVNESAADYWQAVDADAQRREIEQLRAIHKPDGSSAAALRSVYRAYINKPRPATKRGKERGRDQEWEPDD
ncbi:MobA/MobL family protein [Bradyrhizobium sp. LA7.1]|uniref:MobA/MobL family protein n=1 Tax=Bradyrhizobium sp. LA7.1 TaxID=3156324 RepID=UPI00339146A3